VRAQSCVGEPSVTGGASVTVLMRRRKRRAKTCPKVHALVCLIVCSFVGVAWLCWFIGSSVALRLVVRKILFVCLFVFVCFCLSQCFVLPVYLSISHTVSDQIVSEEIFF
jgi:hypothetical protein